MVNQQLVEWVRSYTAQGYTIQQLYDSLVQQGYSSNDANEAIKSAQQISQTTKISRKGLKFLPILIAGIIFLIIVVGGVFAFFLRFNSENVDLNAEPKKTGNILPTKESKQESKDKVVTSSEMITEQESMGEELNDSCKDFPDKLDACEPFSCEFVHPFSEQPLRRTILGFENGKCQYIEEMPNAGVMTCEYTEDVRKKAAQLYREILSAENIETEINLDIGGNDSESTTTIDGKKIEDNFLQEAFDSGKCVISGY
jgi:hypothetical protein